MNYIVFDDLQLAIRAIEICWIQYLKEKVCLGCIAVNGREYSDISGLNDDEICSLRLYGKDYQGNENKEKGMTINYQLVIKSYSGNKWFFAEPPYLSLLSGYTVKTAQQIIDAGYYPPEEI